MNRTDKFFLAGLGWTLLFSVLLLNTVKIDDLARRLLHGDLLAAVCAVGEAALFFGWAKADAAAHGKPARAAAAFTALGLALTAFAFAYPAYFAYLFYTRGRREGLSASGRLLVALLCATATTVGWIVWVAPKLMNLLPG